MRFNISIQIIFVLLVSLIAGCAKPSYYTVKQRYNVIMLSDLPVGEHIKQPEKSKKLAGRVDFFIPELNEPYLMVEALNNTDSADSYIEGHFETIHIPILFHSKSFYGRRVHLKTLEPETTSESNEQSQ